MSGQKVPEKRNTVLQRVRNRNNIADLYLRRKMTDFRRHLTFRFVALEMEKLDWHSFLKNLKKCDSDDLAEFVPLLVDELGEHEYTGRVGKLKTRFCDIYNALELGLTERLSMDYHKIKEDGLRARKDYRRAKAERLRRSGSLSNVRPTSKDKGTLKTPNTPKGEISNKTSFITHLETPAATGVPVVKVTNGPQVLCVSKTPNQPEVCEGSPRQCQSRSHVGKPFFPNLSATNKEEVELVTPAENEDDARSREKSKGRTRMCKMVSKNSTESGRRRQAARETSQALEAKISEFLERMEKIRIAENPKSSGFYLPPITAY